MLAGETPIDAGELSLEKGARVALHDQRPPRERDLSLRDYVLSGCADLIELEKQLGRLEQEMASGSTDQATLDDTRPRRLGSSTPAAMTGAAARRRWCADSASRTKTSTGRCAPSRAAS